MCAREAINPMSASGAGEMPGFFLLCVVSTPEGFGLSGKCFVKGLHATLGSDSVEGWRPGPPRAPWKSLDPYRACVPYTQTPFLNPVINAVYKNDFKKCVYNGT